MANLSLLVKRSLPALLLLGIALYLAQTGNGVIRQWSAQFPFVPALSLALAAALAWWFGRSRLVLCCAMLALLPPESRSIVAPHLDSPWLTLSLMPGLVYLLWSKDRGFAPLNLLLPLCLLLLLGVACHWALTQSALHPQWIAEDIANSLAPYLPDSISPVTGGLILSIWLSGLLAVLRMPSNNNAVLFVSLLLLPLLHARQADGDALLYLPTSLVMVAILSMLSVLMDSYDMAFRDELTGIPGRRALLQYAHTLGKGYVVVMADVDHFKSFNDTYGHDVGDQVLKLVAAKLCKVSGGGKAFRFGGEEFTLVFAGKTPEQVLPHVEALRRDIADYAMVIRGKDRPAKKTRSGKGQTSGKRQTVRVTCSFGMACRTKTHTDFHGVIKQADLALYDAKKAGRNCIKQKS